MLIRVRHSNGKIELVPPRKLQKLIDKRKIVQFMRSNGWACLPVIKDDHLVGVLTESKLMEIAGKLLEEKLRQ